MILPKVFCGPAVLDHCLQIRNMAVNMKIRRELIKDDLVKKIHEAILNAHQMTESFKEAGSCCGYVITVMIICIYSLLFIADQIILLP